MKGLLRTAVVGGLSIAIAAPSVVGGGVALASGDPPTIDRLELPSVDEGSFGTLSGWFSDNESTDQHTVDVLWGDGTTSFARLGVGARTFVFQKRFADDLPSGTAEDPMVATVRLNDGTTEVTQTVNFTVRNVAPMVLTFTLSAAELAVGGSVTATGTFDDPGGSDRHNVTVDWGDGTSSEVAVPFRLRDFTTPAHTYTRGGSLTVTARVTDDDTGVGTGTASVVVTGGNAAPTDLAASVAGVNEGSAATLVGGFTDPDGNDTHTVVVEWGDGSPSTTVSLAGGLTNFGPTHVYADSGTYPVAVTVTDSAGQAVTTAASAAVANVAPAVGVALVPASVTDHQQLQVNVTSSDPGVLDTSTVTVDFGDGSTPATGSLAAGSSAWSTSHAYVSPGPYTVTATVVDKDDGAGSATAALTVTRRNTAPGRVVVTPTPGRPLANSTVVVTFVDDDTGDTHGATVDWGDGSAPSTVSVDRGARGFAATHVYAASGAYDVAVTVRDAAGLSASGGASMVVPAVDSVAALLDELHALVASFDLDFHVERWLFKRIEDLKASLADGNTEVCNEVKWFHRLSGLVRRALSDEEMRALSDLMSRLEAAANCAVTERQAKKDVVSPAAPTKVTDRDQGNTNNDQHDDGDKPKRGRAKHNR